MCADRLNGKITTWKDEQGFGFITPRDGGPAVFVHIKAFASRAIRPVENDAVTYELQTSRDGQQRAEKVAFVRSRSGAPNRSGNGMLGPLATVGFVVILGVLVIRAKLPPLVPGIYLAMSVLAFLAYAADKAAARGNRWRTQESTLHLLGLAGGWPGALLAQRMLRHKSSKRSFQVTFWACVIVNCSALAWLLTPTGAEVMRTVLQAPQLSGIR